MKKIIYIALFGIITLSATANAQMRRQPKIFFNKVQSRLQFANDMESTFPNSFARIMLNEAEIQLKQARNSNSRRRSAVEGRQIKKADKLIGNALQIILKKPVANQRQNLKVQIEEAGLKTRDSGNRKAEQLLAEAKEYDSNAAEAFNTRQYQKALENHRKARYSLNKAIDLIKNEPSNLRIKADNEKEQLDILLEKANRTVQRKQNPDALALFESSERQIRLSQKEINKGNYQSAIEHYHKAARLLLRIIDMSDEFDKPLSGNIHDEVAALDALVIRVRANFDELPQRKRTQSSAMMNQIYEVQRTAHQNLEAGQYEAAQSDVRQARNLIERASRTLEKNVANRSSFKRVGTLAQLRRKAKELQNRAQQQNDKEAGVMLEYASEAMDHAFVYYRNYNSGLAQSAVAVAQIYVKSAKRMLDNPNAPQIDKNVLNTKLDSIYEMIDKLNQIQFQLNPADKGKLNSALKFYDLAADEYEKGNLRVAYVSLQISEESLAKLSVK